MSTATPRGPLNFREGSDRSVPTEPPAHTSVRRVVALSVERGHQMWYPAGGGLVENAWQEVETTSDPNPAPIPDLSARTDLDALRRRLPVVNDLKDNAVPEFFETDQEFVQFQRWLESERQASSS